MENSINSSNPITWIRDSRGFMKTITAVKLFFFLSTFYFVPSAQAVEQAMEAEQAKNVFHPQGHSNEEKLSNTLQAIKEHVAERKARVSKRISEESSLWQDFLNLFGASSLLAEDLDRLQSMAEATEQLHQKTLAGFADIEQSLKAKGLPEVILQRHTDTVNKYQERYSQFRQKLGQALQAESLQDQDTALSELDGFLQEQQFKRSQQPFDPNNLPFGTPNPEKTREPVTDPQQLNQLLGLNTQPGMLENLVNGVIAPAYAQTGNQPTPADLEPTIDVQITDAIQAKSAELNHSPVEIYNWVRNNIEFMPTYGSIQGSDMTLQTKRGNAFDMASLLIALLRASGIPARYAYGVVRIPADQVMNWVGGVEVPQAALSLLGQGGIPARGLAQSGKITHIEMEHIWVEAWVDFFPSRGFKNIEGDSWIPMDASFKQYDYTDGIDMQSQVPFDAETFAQTLIDSATIDGQAGTVQGIDQQFIEQQLTQYQQQVQDFIENQHPEATVGEALGTKTIREDKPPVLATGLPYELVTQINAFAAISDQLRHKYRFQLQDQYGSVMFSRILNLPEIAGKTLALSFRPKTEEDEQTLLSFIPEDITDLSQLPDELPGYLISMEAELVINNIEQTTGTAFQMGDEVTFAQALYSPRDSWKETKTAIIAGEYHAISIDSGALSKVQFQVLHDDLEEVNNTFEEYQKNRDGTLLNGMTKHSLTGNILQTGVWEWFAISDTEDILTARKMNVVTYRLPSYGKFGVSAKVSYSWGIPKNVGFSGLLMDLDYVKNIAVDKNNDQANKVNFERIIGTRGSIHEYIVPEQLFSTPDSSIQAISAVKALSIAAAKGQKIFTLTQENASQINQVTIESTVRAEILNALNMGRQVTVHQAPISEFGWTGSGYIIFDPETGSGAYKISGGANGGIIIDVLNMLLGFLGVSTDFLDAINTTVGGPFGVFLNAINKILTTLLFVSAIVDISGNPNCSVGQARYLIIVQTLWTVLLIAALFAIGPLALPAIYSFFMLSAMGFAVSQAMSFSEEVICDGG